MLRERLKPPRDVFPVVPWALETKAFRPEFVAQSETAMALGNGFLGIRGSHEENRPAAEPGTYLNGFYELRPLVYGEEAYGLPEYGQTMLNVPDGKVIKLYVDDTPFELGTAELLDYGRTLDMRRGVYRRHVAWRTPAGKRLRLETARFVSLRHRHLAGVDYTLTVEDGEADVVISSELMARKLPTRAGADPRVAQGFSDVVLQPAGHENGDTRFVLSFTTELSGLALACGADHAVATEVPFTADVREDDQFAAVVLRLRPAAGQSIRVSKFLAYHYADDRTPVELRALTKWTLDQAMETGFDRALEEQAQETAAFWDVADVQVDGDPEKQQVIRWNLFQLMQASARVDDLGIPARGVTGPGYEGHYFWDAEIYVLPFLTYTTPRIARNLLLLRYRQLEKARTRARLLGLKGALYPWRTINGDEASAYFLAGTAQYHINADIAYAIRKYVEVTGDVQALEEFGAEILIETARFWASLGNYSARHGGQFTIDCVTGPDEYTALVNNNYYTNLMARENLHHAVETVAWLRAEAPETFARLARKTALDDAEMEEWQRAADVMFLPYDERLGIHLQDDAFLDKAEWDFENTPEEHYPLLLHYHPLTLYRYQVIKQADIVLAMFLLWHEFTPEERRRNFEYYDPRTTGDSSLSVCVQSIIASEIGEAEKAFEHFNFAATMDFSDVGGNMAHGAHIASIGGSWMAIVYGLAGMRDRHGAITFAPRLPATWDGLKFCLRVRDNLIAVDIGPAETTYTLRSGEGISLAHCGRPVVLSPADAAITLPTETQPADAVAD